VADIRYVVFDMDEVLCHYDFAGRLAIMADALGVPAATIDEKIFQSGFDEAADRGEHTAESYLAGFAERLGVPVSAGIWLDARRRSMTPNRDVIALVEALSSRVGLAMLTNNGPLLQRHIADVFPPATRLFADRAFFSCQFGAGKETPDVFPRLLDRLGAEATQTLFIDDWQSYLDNAHSVGLHTHLFRGAGGLRSALSDHGLI
jgi:putative hydrolase of the HAD superfamily